MNKSTRVVFGLHGGDADATISKSAVPAAPAPSSPSKPVHTAPSATSKAVEGLEDVQEPDEEAWRWPDGKIHKTLINGRMEAYCLRPDRCTEIFSRTPGLVEFVRKGIECRIPAGEHWNEHVTISDVMHGYRALNEQTEKRARQQAAEAAAMQKSANSPKNAIEMTPHELNERVNSLRGQGVRVPGYDVCFIDNLQNGRVKAQQFNEVCKSLRETEQRINSGGPLRPIPSTNHELLERALALQASGIRVPGMSYATADQFEKHTISPEACTALRKSVIELEERQAGRTPKPDVLRKAVPSPEPPSRPQAAQKPTSAPKAPTAPKPPESHQETALEHGEDNPKGEQPFHEKMFDSKPFDPKPVGAKNGVQMFQTQGEEHPNCRCSVALSDGSGPAEMMVHPDSCPKCQQAAKNFNARAQQEFVAGSQPGASASGVSNAED